MDVLGYAWNTYGRTHHLGKTRFYLTYLFIVSVSNYTFHSWILSLDFNRVFACWVLQGLILFFTSILVFIEASQMRKFFKSGLIYYYVKDVFNYIDWSGFGLVYAGVITRCMNNNETANSASIMSVATILLWFNLLYYLRPFPSTGPLVRMIFYILNETKSVLLILVIFIYAFSQAFYLLGYSSGTVHFNDPIQSIQSAFAAMMNNFSFDGNQHNTVHYGSFSTYNYTFIFCRYSAD